MLASVKRKIVLGR